MKNRFKPIVDYRQQEIDIKEKEIIALRQQVIQLDGQIIALLDQIHNTSMPTQGKFTEIIQINIIIEALRHEKQRLQNQKQDKEQEALDEEKVLNDLRIEYEKAKYLYDNEQKKQEKLRLFQEQKELDEITQMLY